MLSLNDSLLFRQNALIDGEWSAADDGAVLSVDNPADGTVVGRVPKMGAAETRRAIDAAQRAFGPWRKQTAKARADLLKRWFALLNEHADDLARLMTAEQGKPLAEARGEVAYAASFIEWFAEEARRVYGDVIPTTANDRRLIVTREPVGVVAAITPWNFPAAMITRKVGPALAAGCTVVLKPAEATPFTALALAELATRAGIPPGVFNVVTGDPVAIGGEMTGNPLVKKVTFTGSTAVGRLLMRQSADTIKKLSLELGGNAPFLVFEDADLDAAVSGAIASKYRNAGQTCVCTNRIYVARQVHDVFVEKLAAETARLKVGVGTDADVAIGPLINQAAVRKVSEHIADARAKGARLVLGGEPDARGGNFFQPTVLAELDRSMLIAKEETFGPVAAVFPFDSEEQAIALANDTEFGLASYFYSRDIGRIWRVADALESGMVGINTGLISNEVAPFGGVKQSGLGREGSKYGIEDYLSIKYLCLAGL